MLIPIRHENMSARRWPIITLGLIAVNVIVFLFTHFNMEEQGAKAGKARLHIEMLAAMHPELKMSPDVEDMVTAFRKSNLRVWNYIKQSNRDILDEWDARIRLIEDPQVLQAEMDSLTAEWRALSADSVIDNYAYVPAHPKPVSYITANFLHGGWLHLIGNMWFLWLAGFVLEDTWGRVIYTAVYFVAGAAALQFHALINSGSLTPLIGASGAVAALMGGFLVRFPKMKIEMRWILGIRSLMRGGYSFSASAYWLLPLWLLEEVFYGSISGQGGGGVAHWAHVGGFLFGAAAAMTLKVSGLENKANQAIEAKTSWTIDPEITQATDLMEQGQLDQAAAVLKQFVAAKPNSVDGWNILQQIYWRKGDTDSCHEALIKLCAAHIRAREPELALQSFDEFLNSGGKNMPAAVWFDVARAAENLQASERAMMEYERLASTYPTDRLSVQALMGAGRMALKLNRAQDALRFFDAAAASKVPHLDLEQSIEAGRRQAQQLLVPAPA